MGSSNYQGHQFRRAPMRISFDEFRAGQMIGASEQEEWECSNRVSPGPHPLHVPHPAIEKNRDFRTRRRSPKPMPRFVTATKLKTCGPKSKRLVLNLKSQWQRDQAPWVSPTLTSRLNFCLKRCIPWNGRCRLCNKSSPTHFKL